MLFQTYASQKSYGDKAEMMEFKDSMFQLVLGKYQFADVKQAFIDHVSRKADLPTPSDIVNIIDPPKEKLSQAVYIDIKRRMAMPNEYVPDYEKKYCREFEAQELAKIGD
ncbi:hypothetical protein [Limnoglobus roseus]|nr:hypothetical protein [Limnoglobus roseus]